MTTRNDDVITTYVERMAKRRQVKRRERAGRRTHRRPVRRR